MRQQEAADGTIRAPKESDRKDPYTGFDLPTHCVPLVAGPANPTTMAGSTLQPNGAPINLIYNVDY
jgi:hypothetical protein